MRFALVAEDHGHVIAATTLVDATALAHVDWLDGVLEDSRSWTGLKPEETWYKYNPADARDIRSFKINGRRFDPHGKINGEALKPEAGMWRAALMQLANSHPRPDLVVLVRDMDGYDTRREGMEQVRSGFEWPFPILIATPRPEVEAWHVAGFVPQDLDEQQRLNDLQHKLSFNPVTQSHRLTSHPNDAPTDSKIVLAVLTGGDAARKMACLDDITLLRTHGVGNGLAAFLQEAQEKVPPLFLG